MHHGLFDVSFLYSLPNTVIYSPKNFAELEDDLERAVRGQNKLYVIRYPRGGEASAADGSTVDFDCFEGKYKKTAVVSFGRVGATVLEAAKELEICGVCFNMIKPVPHEAIERLKKIDKIFLFEEGMRCGGFSEHLASVLAESGFKGKISITAVNGFVPHGSTGELLGRLCLDKDGIKKTVMDGING